jgi:hypothetical protein
METTFHNVTITVTAETAKDAYNTLCALLAAGGVEFETDTFSADHAGNENLRDTSELWPAPDEPGGQL